MKVGNLRILLFHFDLIKGKFVLNKLLMHHECIRVQTLTKQLFYPAVVSTLSMLVCYFFFFFYSHYVSVISVVMHFLCVRSSVGCDRKIFNRS